MLPAALPATLEALADRLWVMQERLPLLGAHRGLFLLRSSFSACRIMHVLRSIDTTNFKSLLEPFDVQVADALSSVLSLRLEPRAVRQAYLPTSKGGLGLTSAVSLAGPAVTSSMHAISSLVQDLLSGESWAAFGRLRDSLWSTWQRFSPEPGELGSQRAWMERVHEAAYEEILSESTGEQDRARLLAVARPGASSWLHAIPAGAFGTLL